MHEDTFARGANFSQELKKIPIIIKLVKKIIEKFIINK